MGECPDCKCKELDKCLRILNLMLDNEATCEQEVFFYEHINNCLICHSHFNIELQIRDLVKSKVKLRRCPDNLVKEIKGKIDF